MANKGNEHLKGNDSEKVRESQSQRLVGLRLKQCWGAGRIGSCNHRHKTKPGLHVLAAPPPIPPPVYLMAPPPLTTWARILRAV